MTLVLTLEGRGAAAAAERERRLPRGRLTIGRGGENDWVLPDPERNLSRQHCVIEERRDGWYVTDTSSNGVFLDDGQRPIGRDQTTPLHDGARLRLGGFVLLVRYEAGAATAASAPAPGGTLFDDPFDAPPPEPAAAPPPREPGRGNLLDESWIKGKPLAEPRHPAPRPRAQPPATPHDHTPIEHQALDPTPPRRRPEPPLEPHPEPQRERPRATGEGPFFEPEPEPQPRPEPRPPAQAVAPDALARAFLEGAGIDPALLREEDPDARMRQLGETFRAMAHGLSQLLASRAMVKREIGLEQTLIGASGNNPLKLSVSAEEAVLALIQHRGPGYLEPKAAVHGAFDDLKAHELAVLDGMQAALARLLGRFDPDALERELARDSLLANLVAGGRKARLWEAFKERYGDIAGSARARFLGELGADFADAYQRRSRSSR